MKLSANYQSLLNKGIDSLKKNQLQLAKKYFLQIYNKYPSHPTLTENISKICIDLHEFEEAHIFLLRSLNKSPNDYTLLVTCAYVQLKIGILSEAEKNIKNAIKINPEKVEAYQSLTAILIAKEDLQGALTSATDALKINPFSVTSLNNLGATLTKLNNLHDAKSCFETSLAIEPENNFLAIFNLASIEYKLFNIQTSIELFEKILNSNSTLNREYLIPTKWSLSSLYLHVGDLDKGWEYYKYGFDLTNSIQNRRAPNRSFTKPRWDFKPLNGKILLIWCEQGLGDEIDFLSILPDLPYMTESIIIECDKRLVKILSTNFPQIHFRETSYKNDFILSSMHDDFDFQVPIGDLMKLYRNDISKFQKVSSYLKVDEPLKSKFKSDLDNISKKKKIGICWRSGKLNPERNINYTNLADWGDIFKLSEEFDFVNLQYGECEDELLNAESLYGLKIIRWPKLDLKNDLDSVAALLSNLDLVVTIGSAVSCLAGAVGTKQLLMMPDNWSFFGQKNYSPFLNKKLIIPKHGSGVTDVLVLVAEQIKTKQAFN